MSVLRARLIGLAAIVTLAAAARLPVDAVDGASLARRFDFASTTIDPPWGVPLRQTRDVHPDLQRIAPWIASVGAAAAMGDADGNLRPDDLCYVDTRSDSVVVAPLLAPRYAPFRLAPPAGAEPLRTIAPMGCLIGDLNEDGLPDLLVYYWGRPPVAFLRIDRGMGAPEPLSAGSYEAFAIAGEQRWFSNAALLADFDGDGHADLLVGNYFCDDGRILDSRSSAPVCAGPPMQHSMSRASNGGANRILLWTSARGGAQPSVTYRETAAFSPEVAHGWTLAAATHDLNGDGLPELYFANDFGPDRLLINCSDAERSFGRSRAQLGCFPIDGPVSFRLLEGERGLTKPRSKVLGRDSFKGMGVEFADLSGDGLADIYVSNITEKWALQESQALYVNDGRRIDAALLERGHAPFRDDSEALGLARSGWAWDAKLADFDNDGRLEALQALGFVRGRHAGDGLVWRKSCWAMLQELATANDELLAYPGAWFRMEHDADGIGCDLSGHSRNAFFVRHASGRYVDAAPWLAHLAHGTALPTRGLAIGDADLDGRLDYVEARQYAAPAFHRNRSDVATGHGFIGLSPRFWIRGGAPRVEPLAAETSAGAGSAARIAASDGAVATGAGGARGPEAAVLPRSRPAVGARVEVLLSDGRRFSGEIDGGNGHSGKRSHDLHIGLGAVPQGTRADVVLRWRAAGGQVKEQRFAAVPINAHSALLVQP